VSRLLDDDRAVAAGPRRGRMDVEGQDAGDFDGRFIRDAVDGQ
jgi:hypothetical protein